MAERSQAAVEEGLLKEDDIRRAVRHSLRTRMAMGEFDPPERSPWGRLDLSVVDSEAHRGLARRAAEASMVLLEHDA